MLRDHYNQYFISYTIENRDKFYKVPGTSKHV